MSTLTDHFRVEKKKESNSVKQQNDDRKCDTHDNNFDKLRKFDLDWKYGPSVGISRIERWERAEKFGLSPPEDIKRLIMLHSQDDRYTESVWNDYSTL